MDKKLKKKKHSPKKCTYERKMNAIPQPLGIKLP